MSKAVDFERFKAQLGQSPMLTAFATPIAWSIPSIEIILAITIMFPAIRILSLYGSLTLMSLFTGYIIMITNFAEYIPCSCGGILQNMGWTDHLIFNIGFMILAIIGIYINPSKNEIEIVLNNSYSQSKVAPITQQE